MSSGRFATLVLLGLAIIAGWLSLFTVDERELAIKLRLGQVVRSDYEPGLQLKWLLVENVRKFPRRILTISDRPMSS